VISLALNREKLSVLYVTNKVSVTDKLKFLWCLCLIAHYKEQGTPILYSVKQEFGDQVYKMFLTYQELGMAYGYIAPDSHTLTKKGARAVERWRHISNKIYNVI